MREFPLLLCSKKCLKNVISNEYVIRYRSQDLFQFGLIHQLVLFSHTYKLMYDPKVYFPLKNNLIWIYSSLQDHWKDLLYVIAERFPWNDQVMK